MKTMRHMLTILLAVISIAACVLYILCFILNLTTFSVDFFRSYVPKTILWIGCILCAIEAALMIAENRKWLRRRWRKRKKKGAVAQKLSFIQIVRLILPHLCIMIWGMFTVFYFIDNVNPIMNFIYHKMTEGLLLAEAIMGIVLSALLILDAQKALGGKKRGHSH